MLVFLAALLIITQFLPQFRLVTRLLRLQQILSSVLAVLTAATTFTLFSEAPTARIANDLHATDLELFHSSLRNEWNSVGQYLVSKTLKSAIKDLDRVEKNRFEALFKDVSECDTKSPPGGSSKDLEGIPAFPNLQCNPSKLARIVARNATDEALKQPEVQEFFLHLALEAGPGAQTRTDDQGLSESLPATRAEWSSEVDGLERQQSREKAAAELRQSETKEGFKGMLAQIVGTPLPEITGIGGAYLSQVADILVHAVSDGLEKLTPRLQMSITDAKVKWDEFIDNSSGRCKEFLVPTVGRGKMTASASNADFERATALVLRDAMVEEAAKRVADTPDGIGLLRKGLDDYVRRGVRAERDPLRELLEIRLREAIRAAEDKPDGR